MRDPALNTGGVDRLEPQYQSGGPQDKAARSRLVVLILLVALLGAMIYFYQLITQPPEAKVKPESESISHVLSIYGWGKERLSRPNWASVDSDGQIFVADTANHPVVAF